MEGKFVVFEGLDGSGKSTQVALYAQYLTDLGVSHLVTAEPSWVADKSELLSRYALARVLHGASGEELALMFAADRRAHLQAVVLPALAEGKVVLCDRYVLSSYAYQAAGAVSVADTSLTRLVTAANEGVWCPDATVVLEVPADEAFRRVARRGPRSALESADLDVYRARAITYQHAHVFPYVGRVVEVDGTGPRTQVAEDVRRELDPLVLPERA